MADKIQMIYDLQEYGGENLLIVLDRINKEFAEIKKTKQALNNQMGGFGNEAKLSKALLQQIQALNAKEIDLKAKREELISQSKKLQLSWQEEIALLKSVNKELSELRKTKVALSKQGLKDSLVGDTEESKKLLAQLQALTVKELELKTRRQELINQAKQNQIIRQQELAQQRQIQAGNTAMVGSYNELAKRFKEINNLLKNSTPGSSITLPDGTILEYEKALDILKQLKNEMNDYNRQLSPDGTLVGEYKTGIINAFKEAGLTDLIDDQLKNAKLRVKELDDQFEILRNELSDVRVTGQGSLEVIERQLIENREAANQLNGQIGNIEDSLRGSGTIGDQVTSGLKKSFKDLKAEVGQLVLGYLGFQAAISAFGTLKQNAIELSDETTNLEIELRKAAGGADKLVDSLSKIDTRTKLVGLEQIANISIKAGVTEENLVGVVRAIDKVKVAFGKDFGDIEKGTEDIIKLIGIFEGTDQVIEDSIVRTGNAIRVLANESTASVPFLNDFSGRVAGLKQTFAFTLPDILGLASGFEQFKVSAEVASTAMNKIIPKLATDTEKYAKIIGVTRAQFSELINTNPAEAFIKVSEALVKTKGGVEAFSTAFADSELGSGRISNVIAVAGGKAEEFRKAVVSAGEAYTDTGNIEDAFAAKNTNLAATFDKLSKSFADAANNEGFKALLVAIGTAAAYIISLPFGGLITVLGIVIALTNTWVGSIIRSTLALGFEKAALVIEALQLAINNGIRAAATTTMTIYTAAIIRSTAATGTATIATRLLAASIAFLTGPIGLIVGLTAVLVTVFGVFTANANKATDATNKFALAQAEAARREALNIEITKRANDMVVDRIDKVKQLTKVVNDLTLSDSTRRKALEQLIALNPAYRNALNGEMIDLKMLNNITNQYIETLNRMALAKAKASVKVDLYKDLITSENNLALQGEKAKQEKKEGRTVGGFFGFVTGGFETETEKYNKQFEQNEETKRKIAILEKQEQDKVKTLNDNITRRLKLQQDDIKSGREKTAIAIENARQLKMEQDELNIILGSPSPSAKEEFDSSTFNPDSDTKTKKYSGAKLDGYTKDNLKEIDTETEAMMTALEKRKLEGTILEVDYYKELEKITQEGIAKKLAAIKNGNAEEKLQKAKLDNDSIKAKQDLNKSLFDLEEKAINDRLESAKREATNKLKLVTDNPLSTPIQKAQAELLFDETMLAEQMNFGNAMDKIEKEFNQKSKENAQNRKDDISEADRKILNDKYKFLQELKEAQNKAITDAVDINVSNENEEFYNKQKAVFERNFQDKENENLALQKLEREHNDKLLRIKMAGFVSQKVLLTTQLAAQSITWEEYKLTVAKINEEIAKATAESAETVANTWADKNPEFLKTLGDIIKGLQIVSDVMGSYFDLQSQRIDNEQKSTEAQIEEDKKKELSLAGTEEEKKKIEEKYDGIKASNAKKYQEQRRSIALKELAIQSAINALTAFGQGLKDFGILGGGLYAAAALAQYFIARQKIMEQQFEKGGSLKRTLNDGGVFDGPSHAGGGIPFSFGGRNVEVEGQEGYVVNKKSMASQKRITVTGTPAQVASAANVVGGGYNFSPGAKLARYEYGGMLGLNLQAPYIPPRMIQTTGSGIANNSNNDAIMQAVVEQAKALQMVSNQLLNLKVSLNPNKVSEYQKEKQKIIQIGTL